MVKIDAIRSQARQVAWRYTDGEKRNYNPFARTSKGRNRAIDEEESIRHVRTADSVPSREEQDRRDKNQREFPPPHHADTAPPTSAVTEHAPRNMFSNGPEEKESSDLSTGEKGDLSSGSHNTTDNAAVGESTESSRSVEDGKPRKRKFLRFGKDKKDEDDSLERSDTGKSKKRKQPNITAWGMFKATVFGSWVNVLLVAVPVGIAIGAAGLNGIAMFVVNFIAIIPLAAMLSFATEEVAMYVGETLGGLLNATFGNATELIGM